MLSPFLPPPSFSDCRDLGDRIAIRLHISQIADAPFDGPNAAFERYRQVTVAEPRNVEALVGAGVALAQLGKLDDAIDHYQRALALDANDADAHNKLGGALALAGRLREAIPHFARAVELNPRDENAKRNLEKARELAGQR